MNIMMNTIIVLNLVEKKQTNNLCQHQSSINHLCDMNELWFSYIFPTMFLDFPMVFLHFPYNVPSFSPPFRRRTFALEDAKHRSQVAAAHLRSSGVVSLLGEGLLGSSIYQIYPNDHIVIYL